MVIAKVSVSGAVIKALERKPITAGMVGVEVEIAYTDPMWDGLRKTAVFSGSGVTKGILNAEGMVKVPPETIAKANFNLKVGIYGVDAMGKLLIPTVWVSLGRIWESADPSADPSTDPTLPVWAKLEGDVEQLQEDVEQLKQQGAGSADPEAIEKTVEEYLTAHPPSAAPITINGEKADENGNFIVNTVTDVEIAQLAAAMT